MLYLFYGVQDHETIKYKKDKCETTVFMNILWYT